jgi:UDP-GlcNAc:undecaprenyl-phosphate/decaprenyl-phosphate GlcNAc-1-phosphate transferase
MRTAGVAFVLACLVSGLLTPLVRRFALKHRLFDNHVAARKIHGRPLPRLGGIAIAAGFYAPLLALLVVMNSVGVSGSFYANSYRALAFLLGGVAICGLGLYDDIRGSTALKKFLFQFAVAGVLYWFGFRIEGIMLPFVGIFQLGPFSLVFTLVWIVGVINAMNLIDGLDGLAAGVGLFGLVTTFILAALRPDPVMMLFMASLGGATLGFLFYNFNPASIFMGDSGSMFLGYVLAVGAIQTSLKASTTVAILVPVVALGLPITDTLLAMIRRAANHQPMFSADRAHIHHKLLDLGLSQKQAVLTLYAACILLGGMALLLTVASGLQTSLILLTMGTAGFFAIRRLGYGRVKQCPPVHNDLMETSPGLVACSDERKLWQELKTFAKSLSMTSLRLHIECQQDGDPTMIEYSYGDELFNGSIEIPLGTSTVRLEYHWKHPRDMELEQLKQNLETAGLRLFPEPSDTRMISNDMMS